MPKIVVCFYVCVVASHSSVGWCFVHSKSQIVRLFEGSDYFRWQLIKEIQHHINFHRDTVSLKPEKTCMNMHSTNNFAVIFVSADHFVKINPLQKITPRSQAFSTYCPVLIASSMQKWRGKAWEMYTVYHSHKHMHSLVRNGNNLPIKTNIMLVESFKSSRHGNTF